jgi:hypothetical protein
MKNTEQSSGNVKKLVRFHVGTRYQYDRARKILSELELFANGRCGGFQKKEAAQ